MYRPNDALLFFNPYIGDTILSTAFSKKFGKAFGKDVYVVTKSHDMSHFVSALGGLPYCDYGDPHEFSLSQLLMEGSKISKDAQLSKALDKTGFTYKYQLNPHYEKFIESLCKRVLSSYFDFTFNSVFLLHYSFPFAKLGQMARKRGIEVYGYVLDDNNILQFIGANQEPKRAVIWNGDYIGNRLSKAITGQAMARQDYALLNSQQVRKGITLFPATRSHTVSAGNWETDIRYLDSLKIPYKGCYHHRDTLPKTLTTIEFKGLVTVLGDEHDTLDKMITIVKESEAIICYDSASFHMAWLTDTPAIVKLKGGFNREWVPPWVAEDSRYYFIPATPMYEEEYLEHLKLGLHRIGVM